MKIIIIVAVIFIIYKVISKEKVSKPPSSNSTISKIDTEEYISLDEYDKLSRNNVEDKNIISEQLIGTIKSFDNSQKIGSIVSDNYIYEIIFQRNFNYNSFPNHMPKVNDKVVFLPQAINEKLFASNIEYYQSDMIINNINSSTASINNSSATLLEEARNKQKPRCPMLSEPTKNTPYYALLQKYRSKYKEQVFQRKYLSEIQSLVGSQREISEIKSDLKHVREGRGIIANPTVRIIQNEEKNKVHDNQTQTTSTTPPVQPQSILDEQKLLNYIKSKPVKWEYANPNALQNEALKKLCSVFLSSESVSNILSPERCANMELIIQQKRARTPRAADYNKVMDMNILFELYKYSYLMTAFQVLENRKNDTLKIDQVKLWDLIQEDCRKRLENLEQEKRNNPTIRNMFQKYEYDTSKIKMVVNDYVEPREYDYIYASLMTNALLVIIMDCVLNGEADIGNGYQPILQIIKQYSASDLMAALDSSLNSVVNFTLGMYANGGKIPRRTQ